MPKKIIIAGGGTGGHIFPAIAIANALRKIDPSCELLFVGAKGKMEMEKVPQAGYEIRGIDIVGFNRSSLIKNVGLPFKLIRSLVQVRRILNDFKPDAVIGVGGYSSFPVLRLAQTRRIPTFIHESNSFAGKSNILLGKKATKVFVATEGMEKFFPREKLLVTGNPVRENITTSRISREDGIRFFSLDPGKQTILATGGSLGAKGINEAIGDNIERFRTAPVQLIWQTGKPFASRAKELSRGMNNVWTNDFIPQMEYAYAAADVVISRAGAMAIAELSVAGKPVIFVPFPFAAEDHQTANARALEEKGAALMVRDADASANLIREALQLAADKQAQIKLQNNIKAFAKTDADKKIADEVFRSLQK